MKKNQLFILAISVMSSFMIMSCGKDNSKSKTEFLTQRTWKPISFLQDGVEEIDSCGLDDTYSFANSGTGTLNVGSDDCDGDESNGTFPWSFIENETKMVFDGDTAVITQLDDNTLKLTYDWDGVFIETYKH